MQYNSAKGATNGRICLPAKFNVCLVEKEVLKTAQKQKTTWFCANPMVAPSKNPTKMIIAASTSYVCLWMNVWLKE
jgi:hypothetical protein